MTQPADIKPLNSWAGSVFRAATRPEPTDHFSDLSRICRGLYEDDGTEKPQHYLRVYADILGARRFDSFDLLELGVSSGASLLAWRQFFPNANIVGLDIRDMPSRLQPSVDRKKLTFVQGDQSSADILQSCVAASRSGKFDVIIDDASHVGWLSRASFEYLFRHGLKPKGLYFIEDYGTGYMPNFWDGSQYARAGYSPEDKVFPSHAAGMVGWSKQLIDEMHLPAVIPAEPDHMPIESIQYWPSIALVRRS